MWTVMAVFPDDDCENVSWSVAGAVQPSGCQVISPGREVNASGCSRSR